MNSMKIISCNLGMNLDSKHLQKSAKLFEKENADIIVFQEVMQKPASKSSLEIINHILGFKHFDFSVSHNHSQDYGKGKIQKEELLEGLGILSKIPFEKKDKMLPMIKGLDRWPRLAVRYQFKTFSLTNLHLSKHKESRDLEKKEIPSSDILAGDFNMLPEEFSAIFPKNTSYSFRKYVSYPSKKQTLDYFVLHKGTIEELKTLTGISDHDAICVKILFPSSN